MSDTVQMVRRYGPWLAGMIAVLVVVGAVGREADVGEPMQDGYSIAILDAAGRDDVVPGYVPVQMHEPFSPRFQPAADVPQEEIPDQYRKLDNNDFAASQLQAAALNEEALRGEKKNERRTDGLFSSLKGADTGAFDALRKPDTGDSRDWGWLAEGARQEQVPGRINTEPSTERRFSPMESMLKKDLFPQETREGPASIESAPKSGSFKWRSSDEGLTP